ncbi:MAG: YtxH domain-containing protein [Pedobacter sp.]
MGFIKNALIGIAIYKAFEYLTKPDAFGRTKIDEIKEKAPEWIDRAKSIKEDLQEGKVPQALTEV